MQNLIGLGHYSRTGKNALALHLQRQLGGPEKCRILSFAYKLKQVCHDLFAWAGVREPEFYETPDGIALRDVILPQLGLSPVELWIKFGTPIVREQLHPLTWINITLHEAQEHLAGKNHWCVITDVRFPNEASAIREADGLLVRVDRPGVLPRHSVADLALVGYAKWDFVVNNAGLEHDLSTAARLIVRDRFSACGDCRPITCSYGVAA